MKDFMIIQQRQKMLGFIVAFLLAVTVLVLLFHSESSQPEKRTLAIYGAVHVYRTNTPPANDYPGSDFIDVIGPKDHVRVIQVVQKRNYVAVRIRLSDGREGWVFSGESMELYEPGCRGPDFRTC